MLPMFTHLQSVSRMWMFGPEQYKSSITWGILIGLVFCVLSNALGGPDDPLAKNRRALRGYWVRRMRMNYSRWKKKGGTFLRFMVRGSPVDWKALQHRFEVQDVKFWSLHAVLCRKTFIIWGGMRVKKIITILCKGPGSLLITPLRLWMQPALEVDVM